MRMLVLCLILVGCATSPVLPEDTEASAAIGSVSFWRWAGRAVMALINASEIKVELKSD